MILTVNVPPDVYQSLAAMAGRHDVSVERMLTAAVTEQVSQWARFDEFAKRDVSRESFLAVLDSAPDVEPNIEDRP